MLSAFLAIPGRSRVHLMLDVVEADVDLRHEYVTELPYSCSGPIRSSYMVMSTAGTLPIACNCRNNRMAKWMS